MTWISRLLQAVWPSLLAVVEGVVTVWPSLLAVMEGLVGSGGGCCGSVALITTSGEGVVGCTEECWQWWSVLLAVVEGVVSSTEECWQWWSVSALLDGVRNDVWCWQ